jgi:hypothetical protein
MEHIKPSIHNQTYVVYWQAHFDATKCGKYVPVLKKISLTAIEKPLIETHLTVRNTYHGNETDIHNEQLEVGQANF